MQSPSETESLSLAAIPLWAILLVGACLPVTAVVLWRLSRWWLSGKSIPEPVGGEGPTVRWPAWFGLVLFAGMLVLVVAITGGYDAAEEAGLFGWGLLDVPPMFRPGIFLAQIVPPLVGLAVVLGFGRETAAAIGLRLRPLGAGLWYGAAAFAAVFPVCLATLQVNTLVLLALRMPVEAHPLLQTVSRAPAAWTTAVALFQAGVLAPVSEEFMYRGVLLKSLSLEAGVGRALVISSLVFAFVHVATEPQALLPLICLGLVLGYIAHRTGSLLAPMVTHSLFNTVMILGAISSAP